MAKNDTEVITPKCPYCGSSNTRKSEEASYWFRHPVWSCDDCEGRTFDEWDIDEVNNDKTNG